MKFDENKKIYRNFSKESMNDRIYQHFKTLIIGFFKELKYMDFTNSWKETALKTQTRIPDYQMGP